MIKNLRKQKKANKGITLIALVITIIVLLILAGISIATLTGENGVLNKAKKAKEEQLIEQYREEINLIITDEIAERKTQNKDELMIVSLNNKIEKKKKEWVKKIYKCNSRGEEQQTFEESTHLLVESKEHYEYLIEVNEEKQTAKIVSFQKGTGEIYTVTYNANGGEGQEETIPVRQGFSVTLKECNYTKDQYKFVGWCESQNGEGEKFLGNSSYKPKGQVTLYAIWELNVATITLSSNDGTNNTKQVTVTKGENSKLPTNTFTNEGYEFVEWNSKADQSGSSYKEGDTMNTTEDIVLYAIWKKKPVFAKNVLKPNASATNAQDKSPFVKYNNLNCRVLYNDATHGLQIITAQSVETVTLGSNDSILTTVDFTYNGSVTLDNNFKKAATSYNHSVNNLNTKAKSYMDTKGSAIDARCLGSIPTLASNSKFQGDVTSKMWSGTYDYLRTYSWNNTFKNADTYYSEDVKQINDLELNLSSEYVWLASRYISSRSDYTDFYIRGMYPISGQTDNASLYYIGADGTAGSYAPECGLRPVFLLSPDVLISKGDGSSGNPYVIE